MLLAAFVLSPRDGLMFSILDRREYCPEAAAEAAAAAAAVAAAVAPAAHYIAVQQRLSGRRSRRSE